MKPVDIERCPPLVLCQLAGWTKETLSQRVKDGIAVKVARGLYDSVATLRNERAAQNEKKRSVVSFETAALKRAQTKRIETENQVRSQELVPRAIVQEVVSILAASITRMLETLSSRLAPVVVGQSDPAVVRLAMQNEVRAIRDTAVTELRRLDVRGELLGDLQAITAPVSRPMGRRKKKATTRKR